MAEPHFMVITGAGASRELGQSGRMPLMEDWAQSLFEDMGAEGSGVNPTWLGLTPDMSGPDFEAQLGRFLYLNRTVESAAGVFPEFHAIGGGNFAAARNWINVARTNAARAVEILRTNLYENFGATAIDDELASHAYGHLLKALQAAGIDQHSVVFVTTNFDVSIEAGLSLLRLPIDNGFQQVTPAYGRLPVLMPEGMVEHSISDDKWPILHLHGAVGWYLQNDGAVVQLPEAMPYKSEVGTPALVLPDPEKEPENDIVLGRVWQEFEKALLASSHVLVIGHGLNDKGLASVLDTQSRRVKVAWACPDATEQGEWLKSRIRFATPLDIEFGPAFATNALEEWVRSSSD